MLLDGLAQRYGCLPSEAMAKADTLDITVMTTAQAYMNSRSQTAETGTPPVQQLTQEEMIALVAQTRNSK